MINLLPYDNRVYLKSLYKRRLFVVCIFIISFALLPLVLVLLVLVYINFVDYKILESQYQKLDATYKSSEVADLADEIKKSNIMIQSIKSDFINSKNVSSDLQNIIMLRPNDVRLTGIVSSRDQDSTIIKISGISGTRDSIIKYGTLLDIKNSGLCNEVSLPITTYTKRFEASFDISCTIKYEKN